MTSCVILALRQLRFGRPDFGARSCLKVATFLPQKQKEQRTSPLLPGLCPPQVLAKFKLLQLRPRRTRAGRRGCLRGSVPRRVGVDYGIFAGAEAAHAALVEATG